MNNSPQRAAKGFTRAFWVSNTVELFERMAYYAVFIVLTIYLRGEKRCVSKFGRSENI